MLIRFTYDRQDLLNIAPKRPNWDLKRDLTKRLSKLERRKQEAILTLIRELRFVTLEVDQF